MFTWDDLVNKEIPNSTYANFNWCTCLPGMTWLTRKFPIALMLILIGVQFTWDDLVNKEIPNSTYANFNWCTCLPGMTWLTRKFPIALMLILIGVHVYLG